MQELFWEYLVWANGKLNSEYRIDLDIQVMHATQRLYRSFVFAEIEPYEEREVPEEYHQYW